MGLMMVFMMVFMMAGAFLLLKLIWGSVGDTGSKAKRTDLEKPKRHAFALGDDGELVALNEDETALLYDVQQSQ